jgi:DNA repair exonuclease SbcCD ATPase subunit
MSWLCLNCETVNFDAEPKCIVCGEERYYTASEVKRLLENHPETKALYEQVKKLTTQNKWLQTRNKNLTQENKHLQSQLEALASTQKQENELFSANIAKESNTKNTDEEIFILNSKLQNLQKQWKRKVLIWQISTLAAACVAVFLLVFNLKI